MTNPTRVLLAEDHALVRAGIRGLLQNLAGVEVAAEAGDGREVMKLTGKHRPDVVLMDVTMPGLNGFDLTAEIAEKFPATRVLILSMHSGEEHVYQAFRAGAAGYLVKDAAPAELATALEAVVRGETYLSPKVSKRVVADYLRGAADQSPAPAKLTPRQREILQLIAEGHTTKEIAGLLNVSVKTVETHRAQLMEKLDIHTIAGLVRYAIRLGLIQS